MKITAGSTDFPGVSCGFQATGPVQCPLAGKRGAEFSASNDEGFREQNTSESEYCTDIDHTI